jgi:ubiquinone/menaquinone biosynthesis C-methylase UbiE
MPSETVRRRPLRHGGAIRYGAAGVKKRLDALQKHRRLSGHRLLDVGCGIGAYTVEMAPNFEDVVAVDIQPQRLDRFRRQIAGTPIESRISIVEASAEELPFEGECFDVITTIEVLEHIEDLVRALTEIHRVLTVGGDLLVTCPNRLFPVETHHAALGPFELRCLPLVPYVPPVHRRLSSARTFTTRSLRRLMGSIGFEHVATDYVMPPFDRWRFGRTVVKPITDGLERTPLKVFGVSIVAVYRKP